MVQPSTRKRSQETCISSRISYVLVLLTFILGATVVFVTNGGSEAGILSEILLQQQTSSSSLLSSSASAPQYALAAHESLGFFRDVTDEDWLRRKRLTNAAEHHLPNTKDPAAPMKDPASWYQINWNEDFSCFAEVAVGGIGEGHKYVCDPHRLPTTDCLVYSIGSNGNFKFERHLLELAPQCEVHVFDPDDYTTKMHNAVGKAKTNAFFHAWGLAASYQANETAVREKYGNRFSKNLAHLQFKTLQQTMKELGHEGRKIDIFKIDCEGCEWRTYRDWVFAPNVDLRQIFMEVHNHPPIGNQMFQDLHDQGYVIFHKEPNIQWGGGNCVEFSFLKLHPDFFSAPSS